jgi:cobalt-zinc-cadmium efflux system outer membrane protein
VSNPASSLAIACGSARTSRGEADVLSMNGEHMYRWFLDGVVRNGRTLATILILIAPILAPACALAEEKVGELTKAEVIARAIAYSPKLKSFEAGIAAAAGTELQSHLLPNPDLTLETENFAGSGAYGGLRGTETTVGVAQFVELGGKRVARQASAAAQRHAAQLELNIVRLDLIRDVTRAFIEAVAAIETLKLATDLEATAKEVRDDVARRVSAARDPLYQRSRAEVALTNAMIARQHAADASAAARQKLARFWGDEGISQPLSDETFFAIGQAPELSSLEARLRDTPDLQRLDALKGARDAELRLAEAGVVPDLTLSAGVRRLQASRDTAFVAGVSLPIPIFNRNQGEIARAGAEVTRAVHDRQQASVDRAKELLDAWSEWQTSWNEADRLKGNAIPGAERAYIQVLSGFRQGAFQYLEVLDIQRTLFETRNAYIAAVARLQTARGEVERLISSEKDLETAP